MGGGSAAFAITFFFGGGGGGAFLPAVGDAVAESTGEFEPKFLRIELATFIAACVGGAEVCS